MPADDRSLLSLDDYERAAAGCLGELARAYIDGGAADGLTLAENRAAFSRLALAPRVLTGAGAPDLAVTVLGRRRTHPVILAPTAFATMAHADGERGLARAAAATASTYCLATLAAITPDELAVQVPDVSRWYQVYVFCDRGITRELIARARESGYEALVLTADRPVLGSRDGERRAEVRAPGGAGDGPAAVATAPADFDGRIEPALHWDDVEALAAQAGLPLLVKGILRPDDAVRAAASGAAGVIVSNHGGRQLDTVPAAIDVLPAVRDAVGDTLELLLDGGIRRGTDVAKALALGARAVLVGRPPLWGLAVDGAAGAQRVIEILLAELATALHLLGAASAAALDPDIIHRPGR